MAQKSQREALAVAEQRAAQEIENAVDRAEHFVQMRAKYGYRTGAELFEAALARVESKSIREWATTEHNLHARHKNVEVFGTADPTTLDPKDGDRLIASDLNAKADGPGKA